MIYRDFGKTGLKVSAIGVGCEYVWTADEQTVYGMVQAAVDAGVNYFDLFVGTPSTDIAVAAVKSGKLDVLMFPVNPLFNLLPQDSADARMKGREVRAMTQEERDAYPTKQELYDLCGEMGVPIVAMKPFAAGNILKGHEDGRLKGLLELTPVQCISYILSIPQVVCPLPLRHRRRGQYAAGQGSIWLLIYAGRSTAAAADRRPTRTGKPWERVSVGIASLGCEPLCSRISARDMVRRNGRSPKSDISSQKYHNMSFFIPYSHSAKLPRKNRSTNSDTPTH